MGELMIIYLKNNTNQFLKVGTDNTVITLLPRMCTNITPYAKKIKWEQLKHLEENADIEVVVSVPIKEVQCW
jgi:hypothetical protein